MNKRIEIHFLHYLIGIVVAVAAIAVAITLAVRGPTPKPVLAQSPQQKVIAQAKAPAATKQQASLPCPPPQGVAVMGVCTPKPVQVFGPHVIAPATVDPPACVPDVSSWQGAHIDWGAVKRWQLSRGCTPAGIFKMGEYVVDPDAWTNNAGLLANGMVRQGYWFIRNTGCIHEAQQIRDEAKFLKLSVVWLDDEVGEGYGYTSVSCITPTLRQAGITAVGIYASPGAFPGGPTQPLDAWIASYGPATPPAAPWGGPIKAFQCTDGIFGCVTYIPGIGTGDVSVDYGLTKLGGPSGPSPALTHARIVARGAALHAYYAHGCARRGPVLTSGTCGQFAWRVNHYQLLIDTAHGYYPRCFGHGRDLGAAVCQVVRPAVAVESRASASSKRAFFAKHCVPPASVPLTGACKVFWNRELYFQGNVNSMLGKSRLKG